jgi:RNA polymerase sigma factor (sigma-70 family)
MFRGRGGTALIFPPKANTANERFAQHLWAHRDDLFTFLDRQGLDATNQRTELAIRFGVILRKVWGGSRTRAGARAQTVGALVEWLLQALRQALPATARQFLALAGQPRRWELNDLARRLDEQPEALELRDETVPAPASSDTGLTPDCRRILEAIERLTEGEREASDPARIEGLSQAETAQVLEVSVMTVNRRLNRGLQRLAAMLGDHYSGAEDPAAS